MTRAKGHSMHVRKKSVQVGFEGIVTSIDESILNHEYAKQCTGFVIDDGMLKSELGIDSAKGYYKGINDNRHLYPDMTKNAVIKKVFLYRRTVDGEYDDRLVAHMQDGYFWQTKIFEDDVWHMVDNIRMFGDVGFVNYNFNGDDVLLLCSKEDGLFSINGDVGSYYSTAPKLTSITVHNERVWGGANDNSGEVWFSDDFNPANWNVSSQEAGFIYFADGMGEVLKVVSFLNYVYVFREYGIIRITAYGNQSEFLLKTMFTDTGYIYKDTIALADDKIIFYAEGGIFIFDGYNATRVCKELPKVFNRNLLCGAYLDNKYYLACRLNNEGAFNNSICVYDIEKKSLAILDDVYIKSINTIKIHKGADVLCTFAFSNLNKIGMMSTSGKVLDIATNKKYISPINNLSITDEKIVRKIHIKTKYPIRLIVILDGNKTCYELQGKNEVQTINVDKRGFEFGMEIESENEQVIVSPIRVDMDIVEGRKSV